MQIYIWLIDFIFGDLKLILSHCRQNGEHNVMSSANPDNVSPCRLPSLNAHMRQWLFDGR